MAALSASSSRWCPTPEQVMILEDIYNKEGIKTPNAFQIQQITNHLSFYGKIEGKNVFYWFQNHKARERQKLRRSKFMQYQKHLLDHHQPACWYDHYYSASFFTPLPQGGRPAGAAGVHRCCPDINDGIGAGVQRSFQSQLCSSVGQPPLLKTLDLFPLKSTNLNTNANLNKQDPTSTSSRSSSSY